jgi:creatinine amidohydrolase
MEGRQLPDSAPRPMLLAQLRWPQVERLVADGENLCLLPIGATEQHGRHLPTNTDTVIAEEISWAASVRTGVPVLPAVPISSSQAHTARWPGTIAFAPRTFIEACVQIAQWVHRTGFRRLLFVNAHGGNAAPLRVAVDELRCQGDLLSGLVNWFELTPEILGQVMSDGDDVHANRAETALMLHLRPELVAPDEIRDDPDRTIGKAFSYTVADSSVDGLTGRPSEATPEDGAALFAEVVDALVSVVERARVETIPLTRGENSS